jgi:integrase
VIETTLRQDVFMVEVDCIMFLAFSGLRVREALPLTWEAVDWAEGIIQIRREKRGINPFVPILPEMEQLLRHDTEIAALIGDKSGPAIIAQTYGDVRPDHLLNQAKRVRLLVRGNQEAPSPKIGVGV